MISLEDCLAMCELSEDEILAIAEHEHLPEIAAIELGQYLLHLPRGEAAIRDMIVDDIRAAGQGDHFARVAKLKTVLAQFLRHHPAARPEA